MPAIDVLLQQREKDGNPIRVGIVGAGFAARGFALQVLTALPGMRLVAIANRTLSYGRMAYEDAGISNFVQVGTKEEFAKAAFEKKYILTNNPFLLTDSGDIDVIVEITGTVEYGARVVLRAIENGKHVVHVNAELDGTLGPILKHYADKQGVIYTQADGDQPAVLMNLFREVQMLGFKPVLVGNIKSLLDPYRTPDTQKKWAEEHFQRPKMVTSFADGTKISYEMVTIANGVGFPVGKRGMYGPSCKHVDEAHTLFNVDELTKTGLTDYILGAEPSFGVFVLATNDQPTRARYMNVYKMGDGPLYTFYRAFHLGPLEAPQSVARAVLLHDVTLAPKYGIVCEVITLAKKNLKKGDVLDGIGGFATYGMIENFKTARRENLLPMGLSDLAIVKRDIAKDEAITFDDVDLLEDSVAVRLWKEQLVLFGGGK
ncbi:MAG: NAD(P)-dependent oxidoreductase [bacterium]|nr:NAD(P)-dependent oxidoreductase [bacterium]